MTELAVTARPLPVIEAELDLLEQDTRQKETALIGNYIQVGRRLEEVKAQLPHGEWGPWLERRGYPQAKAVKLMKISQAYGQEQQNLFGGEAKSQAFANLGFHKLVQLLAIEDEEDRERFVAEHDVAAMSTRELEKALKERDEAQGEAKALRQETGRLQKALDEASAAAKAAEDEHAQLLQELEELHGRPDGIPVESAQEAIETARRDAVAAMTEKLDKAKEAREKAEEKRKAAEDALTAAQNELKELKSRTVDVAVEVRGPTPEELAKLAADAVEKARAESQEEVLRLKKQLTTADGDAAAFKVHFQAWQKSYQDMMACLQQISSKDPEKAGKFRNAVKANAEGMVAG